MNLEALGRARRVAQERMAAFTSSSRTHEGARTFRDLSRKLHAFSFEGLASGPRVELFTTSLRGSVLSTAKRLMS
jgi:hypothetical protein